MRSSDVSGRPVGIPFWVVISLDSPTPQVVKILAESFEDDWYVAPGQGVAISGMVSDKRLFKTKEEALSVSIKALTQQQNLIEQQLQNLKKQRG